MPTTDNHLNQIVEKFWADNPDLKRRIFRAWYNDLDIGPTTETAGKNAVALFLAEGKLGDVKEAAKAKSDPLP